MGKINHKWPGISVTNSDHALIMRLREWDGILKSVPMKDLLLIAASVAVKNNVPAINTGKTEPLNNNVVNPGLMSKPEYSDYKQYIAIIFYLTAGKKDLKNMSDVAVMVKNFVDYAQRGLRILEANYIEKKDGSENLLDDMVSHIVKK